MSHEENRPEDLRALEAALAALVPRGNRLDRDRLMFLAGQAAASQPGVAGQHRWAWPAAFSAMTAVAASLLAMVVTRPGPQIVERIVEVPGPANDQPAGPTSGPGIPLAGEDADHPWPEPFPAGSPSSYAKDLALGPLLRLRLTEPNGRSAATADPAWLDQLLAMETGSRRAAYQGEESREGAETPASYRQLRERLLEAPGAGPRPRRAVPEPPNPLGARS